MQQMMGRRLVVVFLIGLVLLNYPILALFSREGTVAGIPLLYVYVFVTWSVLIAAMAVIGRQRP